MVKANDTDMSRVLETASRIGRWVITQNVGSNLPTALRPFMKTLAMQRNEFSAAAAAPGMPLNPGLAWDNDFKLYLVTSSDRPRFSPTLSSATTVIDFSITIDSLEEQLLGTLVTEELPDLEAKRSSLIFDRAKMVTDLESAEDRVLRLLSETKVAQLLDDDRVVGALSSAQKTAEQIKEKMHQSEETEREVMMSRDVYRPVAARAALLFFAIRSMSEVERMYQYSLEWLVERFILAIKEAPSSAEPEERVKLLVEHFTQAVFVAVSRGIYERHKLLWSLQLALWVARSDLFSFDVLCKATNILVFHEETMEPARLLRENSSSSDIFGSGSAVSVNDTAAKGQKEGEESKTPSVPEEPHPKEGEGEGEHDPLEDSGEGTTGVRHRRLKSIENLRVDTTAAPIQGKGGKSVKFAAIPNSESSGTTRAAIRQGPLTLVPQRLLRFLVTSIAVGGGSVGDDTADTPTVPRGKELPLSPDGTTPKKEVKPVASPRLHRPAWIPSGPWSLLNVFHSLMVRYGGPEGQRLLHASSSTDSTDNRVGLATQLLRSPNGTSILSGPSLASPTHQSSMPLSRGIRRILTSLLSNSEAWQEWMESPTPERLVPPHRQGDQSYQEYLTELLEKMDRQDGAEDDEDKSEEAQASSHKQGDDAMPWEVDDRTEEADDTEREEAEERRKQQRKQAVAALMTKLLFEDLIVLRCLRPDRFSNAVEVWVASAMGVQYVQHPLYDLPGTFASSSPTSPILFLLTPGRDPLADLMSFADVRGMGRRLVSVSLGRGQGDIAKKAILNGASKGQWVILQNCHLYASWMPVLESIVEEVCSNPALHADFRLWLTTHPTPSFPQTVLHRSVKATNEAPRGLKSLVSGALLRYSGMELSGMGALSSVHGTLLYGLTVLHGILSERRQYGPLGWNQDYSFNDADLDMSRAQLRFYLERFGSSSPDNVDKKAHLPWRLIQVRSCSSPLPPPSRFTSHPHPILLRCRRKPLAI